jgi:hypothetical protein
MLALGTGFGLVGAVLLGVGGENGIGLLMLLTTGLVGCSVEMIGEPIDAVALEPACGCWVQPASSSTAVPAAASLISTMEYLAS